MLILSLFLCVVLGNSFLYISLRLRLFTLHDNNRGCRGYEHVFSEFARISNITTLLLLPSCCLLIEYASIYSINIHDLQYKMCISIVFIQYHTLIAVCLFCCIEKRMDAEMKPCCMCVLSSVCSECRRSTCSASLLL